MSGSLEQCVPDIGELCSGRQKALGVPLGSGSPGFGTVPP